MENQLQWYINEKIKDANESLKDHPEWQNSSWVKGYYEGRLAAAKEIKKHIKRLKNMEKIVL